MGNLDDIIRDVEKVFGKGTIMRASEARSLVTDRFSTGIFDLDMKIGGGFPRGRIVTLKGGFSTGKSAVAMMGASQAQSTCRFCGHSFEHVDTLGEYHEYDCECGKKEPMRVVWLDAEHSFDPEWAEKWNVDTEKLYIIQTEFAEQAIDVTDRCIRSKECDLVVVDSVAALTPTEEVEKSSQDLQVGLMARLMGKALRKWTSGMNSLGLLAETKCTIILINQERMSIGGYRPTLTSPGGKGIDFFESLEIRFKRKDFIEDSVTNRPVGIDVEFTVKKNKTAPMSEPGLFSLYFVTDAGNYEVGSTNTDAQVLRLAAYWKLIEKGGAWLTFPDGTRYQGIKKAAKGLRDNPKLLRELMDSIRDREVAWANNGRDVPNEETTESDGEKDTEAENVGSF